MKALQYSALAARIVNAMSRSESLSLAGIALLFLFPLICSGQTLLLSGTAPDLEVLEHYPYLKNHPDSASAQRTLYKLVGTLQQNGYFTADASPLKMKGDTLKADIYVGDQYHWAYLHPGNLDALMQEKSGFREKFFLEKPFRYNEIAALYEKILEYAENTGYPFASIQLEKIQVADKQVYAALKYLPGPLIAFGKLQLKGAKAIKADFLEAYLGVSTGQKYDERKVERIPDLLRTLPYITLTAPVEVTFQNETADVILTLSERKSNEVDGVVNFLPSEGKGNKLLLTGELNVLLNNLAKSGKQFELRWQRLQVQSQRLSVGYQHPNLFYTPLHGALHFNLFKEDTLFINRNLSLDVGYPFGKGNRLQIGVNWRGSRLTGIDKRESGNRGLASFDLVSLEAGYRWQRLDDPVSPGKGYVFSLESSIGKKKIIPEVAVDDGTPLNWPTVSWQQSFKADIVQYHKLGQSWVLYHQLSAGYLMNDYLLLNDLYRLGGLHSLRGFYDNFFFASRYGLSNLELRLVFEQKPETYSYIFTFYDQAVLLKKTVNEELRDHPAGLGVGINLSTPAGLFSLAYAVGQSESQPFNIHLSKIHFGYISRF